MDFDSNYSSNEFKQQFQHSQTNTRASLLRFRSAPGSLFANVDPHGLFESRFNLDAAAKCCDDEDNYKDNDFVSQSGCVNSELPPQYPSQVGPIDGGFRVESSMGMDLRGQSAKILLRQNSSPIGYDTIRDVGSYRGENASSRDLSLSSSRLKGEMNYSSGLSSSSLGMLTRISESENDNYGVSTGADGVDNLGNENRDDDQFYSHSYPFGVWNDSLSFEENLSGLIKTEVDDSMKSFGDLQSTEVINGPPVLSHHMSLPKTSAAEKVLQFQDTIPCKIRAKRGCATHPRSIAERVRRTKISERMRKLQDLVPNMDKQTNTADMLDLAVEYIKGLQQQHKSLTDTRANCKCTTLQKQV